MAQRLLLEGTDPQEILQRAHQDYGPGVSVVHAERVRSGGVLGFFARETYALTLEVPELSPAPSAPPADALADLEAEDAELVRRELSAGMGGGTLGATTAAAPEPGSFDEAFAELVGEQPVAEPPTRTFARASFPNVEAGLAMSVVRRHEVAEEVEAEVEATTVAQPHSPAPEPAPLRILETTIGTSGLALHEWGAQHEGVQAAAMGPTVASLLALGVPVELLPAGAQLDSRVPLNEVVAGITRPRVRRFAPGSVLVVVGEPQAAMRVATQAAFWAGVPATDVVLAGNCPAVPGHGRRVMTPASAVRARARAEQAQAAGLPLIIAVGTAGGHTGTEAAAELVAAFDPDTTWAAVDVTRHDAQRDVMLTGLASRAGCEALAAVGLAQSLAPAAILDAPLPVAWIDGVPASAVAWAALLGERIAEEAERRSHLHHGLVSEGAPMSR